MVEFTLPNGTKMSEEYLDWYIGFIDTTLEDFLQDATYEQVSMSLTSEKEGEYI